MEAKTRVYALMEELRCVKVKRIAHLTEKHLEALSAARRGPPRLLTARPPTLPPPLPRAAPRSVVQRCCHVRF